MVTEFFVEWYAEATRWTDHTIKTAAGESAGNKALIEGWLSRWQPEAVKTAEPLAEYIFASRSADVMEQITTRLDARSKKILG